jgi:outer membrane beta-barrel protein
MRFIHALTLRMAAPALLLSAAALVPHTGFAADEAKPTIPSANPNPANEQVVVPQVDRRDVKVPRIPSKDFELGALVGTYATQNFGSSAVYGVRLGYHLTEDFFFEGVLAQTKVSDEAFRQVLPGGVFGKPSETLRYYNVSVGWNLFPGEVFIGAKRAKASALYLIGGIGSTHFGDQSKQTFNVGFGTRVFLADWAAIQLDMRDHVFELDILGKRQRTQNIEMTGGLTFFF